MQQRSHFQKATSVDVVGRGAEKGEWKAPLTWWLHTKTGVTDSKGLVESKQIASIVKVKEEGTAFGDFKADSISPDSKQQRRIY